MVLSDKYLAPTPEEIKKYETILYEKIKPQISELPKINLLFDSFCDEAQVLLSKQIGESDKIQELLNDYALNKWVKEGVGLLTGKKQCAFCGSEITDERWECLRKHFDDDSQKLEHDINDLLERIENHKDAIINGFTWNREDFYVNFHEQLETLKTKYNDAAEKYVKHLEDVYKRQVLQHNYAGIQMAITVEKRLFLIYQLTLRLLLQTIITRILLTLFRSYLIL